MNPLIGATAGPSSSRLAVVACCLLCGGLWLSVGPVGFVVAVGTILVWLGLGAPYAVAVGVVGLAASTPPQPTIETVWLPIAAFVCLLWSDAGPATSPQDRLGALASMACLLALGGLVYTILPVSIWLAGAIIVGCTAGLSVLYRHHKRTTLKTRALEAVTTTTEHGRDESDDGPKLAATTATAEQDGDTGRDTDTFAHP
ncbi:hypothetical protein G6M89_15200 [Natronolimnobius sp. AArcel1]|uniref:hypothetical protein n=1 Tax=Natronolimnobius sp. AArcel1 TaxID=1679093 RepID=UPI0013EC0E52|nr:hypothetical protein [Natronolimnobius sp. AArcel1]NGM70340.1 hypothetical protein [Natronolimnobius sp. AArcel1]